MAVTISLTAAAIAIRAATGADTIGAATQAVLDVLFPAAVASVEHYAPDAPEAIQNAALVRLLGWMWDADPNDNRRANALHVSGAAPLLAPFRVHRAGALSPPETVPAPPGGVPAPPENGSFVLTVENGVLTWVEFPLPS